MNGWRATIPDAHPQFAEGEGHHHGSDEKRQYERGGPRLKDRWRSPATFTPAGGRCPNGLALCKVSDRVTNRRLRIGQGKLLIPRIRRQRCCEWPREHVVILTRLWEAFTARVLQGLPTECRAGLRAAA